MSVLVAGFVASALLLLWQVLAYRPVGTPPAAIAIVQAVPSTRSAGSIASEKPKMPPKDSFVPTDAMGTSDLSPSVGSVSSGGYGPFRARPGEWPPRQAHPTPLAHPGF